MRDKGHTSKSKLNLRDGVGKKPGKVPEDPQIMQSCHQNAKTCAATEQNLFQKIIGEYPKPIRTFGPKQAEALSQYRHSAIVYGLVGALATLYFCEWRAVLQYLPYYNGKYKKDE